MEDTYVRLKNCCLHPFRSSASSFSSQYLLPFLKSSRTCVLLLLLLPSTSFTSSISPLMALWRKPFLLKRWPIQLAFLCRIFFRRVFFTLIRSRTSIVTFLGHFKAYCFKFVFWVVEVFVQWMKSYPALYESSRIACSLRLYIWLEIIVKRKLHVSWYEFLLKI